MTHPLCPEFVSAPSAQYIDHMGTDQRIVQVARVSFENFDSSLTDKEVFSLLNYLARGMASKDWDAIFESELPSMIHLSNEKRKAFICKLRHMSTHWTPFAHTAITLKCAAPIPIRTQAFKHKTGFVENEESRRYITSTPKIYLPEFNYKPEGSIKQGSGKAHALNEVWQKSYMDSVHHAVQVYKDMLADNVCPEQARFVLPQGAIVNWIWTGNLYAYANYVATRLDSHAQADGYPFAKDIDKICRDLFPMAWSALIDQ